MAFIIIFMILQVIALGPTGCGGGSSGNGRTGKGNAIDAVSQVGPATGPLRAHPSNPRYFTDGNGQAIYLTGSHTWNNLQDISDDKTPSLPGGFSGYLDWLQRYHHNFIRLWILEHAWDERNGAIINPHPWPRTGPGNALDGKPKFDLTKFDEAYFERLRQRAVAAQERGFYVAVMLFDDWSTENAGTWKGHPFNVKNNINGTNGDLDNDGLGLEFHTLQIPAITRLQEAYVKKVVETVNNLDSVLYEIANETGISRAWQYHMIELIKEYERGKPKQHPVGMTVGFPAVEVGNAALFASPADWISPNSEGGYRDNPPAADGSKVIIADTDHLWGVGGDHTWVWKSFLRGLNPIYMDDLGADSKKEDARRAMGDTLTYAKRMGLASMAPRNDLASTTYCLAHPRVEYLVYLPLDPHWTESWMASARFFWRFSPLFSKFNLWFRGLYRLTVRVDLSAASGALSVEWFNPSTGEITAAGTITGGANQDFTAPFRGDAVLYIRSGDLS
jgi:hypothetical protein